MTRMPARLGTNSNSQHQGLIMFEDLHALHQRMKMFVVLCRSSQSIVVPCDSREAAESVAEDMRTQGFKNVKVEEFELSVTREQYFQAAEKSEIDTD